MKALIIFSFLWFTFMEMPFFTMAMSHLRSYCRRVNLINRMSADDCLQYALRDKPNAVVTVGTLKDGKSEWKVYGENGVELPHQLHTYEIASITKTITGILIERAAREGLLNIDDSISNYIDLPSDKTYPTIRDLLTHTSGYKSIYVEKCMNKNLFRYTNLLRGVTDKVVIKRLGKIDTTKKSKDWNYSNFNFAVLGIILERVYKRPYKDLVNKFLEDQGMTQSRISTGDGDLDGYLEWKSDDAYLAAGAVTSNIEDMFIYAKNQFKNNELIQASHRILKDVESSHPCAERVDAMGSAWRIDKQRGFVWHNGATSNYKSYFGFCPETETAVIVLANSRRNVNL